MESLIITDVTVEKAIQKGLIKLNIKREEATIIVKEEGKKGLFGFGHKDAVIEISKKEVEEVVQPVVEEVVSEVVEYDPPFVVEEMVIVKPNQSDESHEDYSKVCDYLVDVARAYGAKIDVTVKEVSKKLVFQIETEKAGLLIGKHGKIINALQILAQTMVYKKNEKAPMVVVNIGDYREKREVKLKDVADRTAKKVLRTKQSVFLEPLPAFERKIIHARLSKYDNITTHSEGNEPYRYLVVDFQD
ncbi:protein jag [Carnobacteriaceae bacterium zg-84]|uniref:RNA-binding cell elongation regulator Jag/EloR n=1 Tax=Granulicatella sp. zg-84 TaxID=2678503 RepID=UPI0013C0456F|nr:RNA-binding cell elongation regulator Jag/EloR [Granulicatella sp. zg-84]NEW66536.1 KH domain-containing protein [Granulicatella sp. zg-84]QMI85814.1 protein jag [Carnobacteriaceae bacterium zg-84]